MIIDTFVYGIFNCKNRRILQDGDIIIYRSINPKTIITILYSLVDFCK